ncbi:catalase [Deinococcus sp.]|uniref:catalase n=1 Tax=Deinococcus sp. TaxID=47478 RepID=UPI0025C62339|nr:catalase [Deinococcus sp.]
MPDEKKPSFAPTEPSNLKEPKAPQSTLTNDFGVPVADNQNSITAGPRGPVLLQDHHLLEKLAHFNRERVPERVVHANGSGAFGTFRVTRAIPELTAAKIFQKEGNECRMLARFSTVAGEQGFADTVRDPRGFALKFYTEDGNWDLVGNNTPVFFIRDGSKFPDFIHSQKRHAATGRRSNTMQFDFWIHKKEAMHQVLYMFGDRGIPRSFRHMNGYGSHTYSLWNEKGERVYVKWHFHTQQGVQNLTEQEATEIAGKNPDYARQDLFDAIQRGEFPKWKVSIQVMTEEQAETYHIHPFDITKIWPHKDFPLMEVGEFELNENPKNFFAEIEQAAFEPSNMPRGFGASPDKMLQARIMSYADAHRYRIGANYAQLPVNRAAVPVSNYQQDGFLRQFNDDAGPTYEPNSFGGPAADDSLKEPPLMLSGAADRFDSYPETDEDYFGQPGALYRIMQSDEQQRIHGNYGRALAPVPQFIQDEYCKMLDKVDPRLGAGVREELAKAKAEPEPGIEQILGELHTHAAGGDMKVSGELVGHQIQEK